MGFSGSGVGFFSRGHGLWLRRITSVVVVSAMFAGNVIAPVSAIAAPGSKPGAAPKGEPPVAEAPEGATTFVGLPTLLDASGSHDPDGAVVRYEWDFEADGVWDITTAAPTVTHTFWKACAQQVLLRVSDNGGLTSTDRTHVKVWKDEVDPTAVVSLPSTAVEGSVVAVDGSGSYDPNGMITSYEWDFESDGTIDESGTGPVAEHVWNVSGTHTVTLVVTDAVGRTGEGTARIEILGDQAPQAPIGLAASDMPGDEGGAIGLSWTANTEDDIKAYRVFRALSAEGPFADPVFEVSGTACTDTGLTNGATYYYGVRAVDNGDQEGPLSNIVSVTPIDNTAPAVPLGLAAADIPSDGGGAIAVVWNASLEPDLAGYRLLITDSVTGTSELIDLPSGTTTYTSASLVNDRRYDYAILAYDISGNESTYSAAVSATPIDELPPSVPANVAALDRENDEGSAIVVYWDANTELDVAGYRVYRREMPDGDPQLVKELTGNSWTDESCTDGVEYGYCVVAYDLSNNASAHSTVVVAESFDNMPPVAVTTVYAEDVAGDEGGSIKASWLPSLSSDVGGYRVDCLDSDNNVIASFDAGFATSHVFDGLKTGTEYAFVVVARDFGGNESAPSGKVFATPVDNTAPASPVGLSAVDVVPDDGGAIAVSWTGNSESDLAGYVVSCYDAQGQLVERRNVGFATSPLFEGLRVGGQYSFEVVAVDIHGNLSAPSAPVTGSASDELAPAAVTADAADVPGDQGGVVEITWTASSSQDVAGYRVLRDGATIADTQATSYTDAVGDASEHAYSVCVYDASGNVSNPSAEKIVAAADNLAPATPANVAAVDAVDDNGGAIAVSFTGSPDLDVSEYRLSCFDAQGVLAGERTLAALDFAYTFQGLTDGLSYSFYVVAVDSSGNESIPGGPASAIPSDNLAPATPAGLTAADVEDDEGGAIRAAWTANTDDTTGYIARLLLAGVVLEERVTAENTVVFAGLTDGLVCHVTVAAFDAAGNTSLESLPGFGASADNLAPAAPSSVTAADTTGDDGGSIDVAWNASTSGDVASYTLYRDGVVLASGLSATSYTDASAATGVSYAYTVSASDEAGNESEQSEAARAASADDLAPEVPAGLTAEPVAEGEAIALSWTAVSGATGYRVFRDGAQIADTADTGMTDTGRSNGAAHSYTVTAYDAAGNTSEQCTAVSATAADTVAPGAPADVSATDVDGDEGGAIAISWSAVADAASYTIYRDGVLLASGLSGTSHTDESAVTGTTYSYTVSATDASGNESAQSEAASAASADNLAPAAPTGVTAADTAGDDGGSIDVTWSASTSADVSSYTLFRDGVVLASGLAGTSYTDTTAATGVTYSYTVSATDASGNESAQSEGASAASADDGVPEAPTDVVVSDTPADEGGSVELAWSASASPDVVSYNVYRNGHPIASDLNSTSYTDATAATDVWYAFTVTAVDAAGNESAPSLEAVGKALDNLAPAAPTGLVASDTLNDNGGSIDLSWSPVEGAATYTVYRDGVELATGIVAASFTDVTAVTGITFSYNVTASDAFGNESPQSAPASAASVDDMFVTLPLAAPTGVSAQDVHDRGGQIKITWTASADARVTAYRILRSTTDGSGYVPVGETNELEFVDPGLEDGTAYYYVVRGLDGEGNQSENSIQASAAPDDDSMPTLAHVENTDDALLFTTGWTTVSSGPYGSESSGGSLDYATMGLGATPGSTSCSLTFNGSQVTWIGVRAFNRGIAAIYIDGVFQQNVDCYKAGSTFDDFQFQAPLYTSPVLANGEHTIKVVYTGTKNAAASGTTYAIDIDAFDVVGPIPDVDAPAAPVGVLAAPELLPEGGAIKVSWTASPESDVIGYKLYRAAAASGPYDLVASVGTVTSHVDNGLENGTTYHYKVVAFDETGNDSPRSISAASAPIAAPTGLVISDHEGDEGTALDLSWSASAESCVVGYKVYRATSEIGAYSLIATVDGATTYTDTNVTKNSTRYYKVASYDGAGALSARSAPAFATAVDNIAPDQPALLSVGNKAQAAGGSLEVRWTASSASDIAGYRLYRAPEGGEFQLVATLGKVTSYVDSSLTNGVTYHYKLAARDTSGNESVLSESLSAMPFAPPTGLVVTDRPGDDGTALDISWVASPESCVVGYKVYRATSATGVYSLIATVEGATSYTDGALAKGDTRYYKVEALDQSGVLSAQTTAVSGTTAENIAPSVPENLTVRQLQYAQGDVGLVWKANTEADLAGYRVYRSTSAEGPFQLVASVSAATYVDAGLPDGTYHYQVAAIDSSDNLSGKTDAIGVTVASTNAPIRIENTDSRLTFTPGWWTVSSGAYGEQSSDGSLNYATVGTNAVAGVTSASFTFTGTQVTWIGVKAFNRGIAAVYLDGEFVRNVDCYAPGSTFDDFIWQAKMYTSPLLPHGEHTIRIVYTGTKNPASSGTAYAIDVDAFDLTE